MFLARYCWPSTTCALNGAYSTKPSRGSKAQAAYRLLLRLNAATTGGNRANTARMTAR